jgi:hypothetical protein
MATGAQPRIEPRIFRIFISYASEDKPIAEAICRCFKLALPDTFAEVEIDEGFLQPGVSVKKQIEAKLRKTDVFIIVYTGAEKPSHGYTGWEVGYFDHVMETAPPRLKIALYVDSPPAIAEDEQGIPLGLGRDELEKTHEKFESELVVRPEDPICSLLGKWQAEVLRNIEDAGFQKPQKRPEQDPASCVRNLKLDIFRYLKGTVATKVEPQKQITIRLKGSTLQQAGDNLPPDAEIKPKPAGTPMAIFGLPDEPITWERFLAATADHRLCASWREAIASVVRSSFPDRVNVDNSQIILSSDEVKAYRVILTTATKYYDDCREFNVYFVETLNRAEFGDQSTTDLLKGLEMVCRFRFMFLETNSEFSGQNILANSIERLPELASSLLKELTFLRKDARDAGLDDPKIWRNFVTWEHIQKMTAEYRPKEQKLREIIAKIGPSKGQPDGLTPLRQELSAVLEEMENAIRPENTLLLQEMARTLEKIGADEHSQLGTDPAARVAKA